MKKASGYIDHDSYESDERIFSINNRCNKMNKQIEPAVGLRIVKFCVFSSEIFIR